MLLLLLLLVATAQCGTLDDLIAFVGGGSAPPVAPLAAAGGGFPAAPSAGKIPSPQIVSPIPFSAPADPTRGVVDLDVPQPKPQVFMDRRDRF